MYKITQDRHCRSKKGSYGGRTTMEKLSVCFMVLSICIVFDGIAQPQIPESTWEFAGEFPDSTSVTLSPYGLAVDNENKVWIGQFYSAMRTEDPNTWTRLSVFAADGSPVDFSPIYQFILNGDTLIFGRITGLNVDHEGNILLAVYGRYMTDNGGYIDKGTSFLFKINSTTGELINYKDITYTGTWNYAHTPTRPAVTDDGLIIISMEWPNSPLFVFDENLNPVATHYEIKKGFSLSLEISSDGKFIFQTGLSEDHISTYYSESGVISEYIIIDSTIGAGMVPRYKVRHPNNEFLLWIAATNHGIGLPNEELLYDGRWEKIFAVDVSTGQLADYIQLNSSGYRIPCSMAFSPDGASLYIGLFGENGPAVHKFSRIVNKSLQKRTVSEDIRLNQNYPNPFNPSTTIEFSLLKESSVRLEVVDILGRQVRILLDDEMFRPGTYSVEWDGKNRHKKMVPSGMYIYRIISEDFTLSKRMLFTR
jgi:hypothetical protein